MTGWWCRTSPQRRTPRQTNKSIWWMMVQLPEHVAPGRAALWTKEESGKKCCGWTAVDEDLQFRPINQRRARKLGRWTTCRFSHRYFLHSRIHAVIMLTSLLLVGFCHTTEPDRLLRSMLSAFAGKISFLTPVGVTRSMVIQASPLWREWTLR